MIGYLLQWNCTRNSCFVPWSVNTYQVCSGKRGWAALTKSDWRGTRTCRNVVEGEDWDKTTKHWADVGNYISVNGRAPVASRCAGWMDSSFSYYSDKAKVSGARKLPEGWCRFVHILQIYADTSRILYHATASHVASSGSKCRIVCALSVNNGLWQCLEWI